MEGPQQGASLERGGGFTSQHSHVPQNGVGLPRVTLGGECTYSNSSQRIFKKLFLKEFLSDRLVGQFFSRQLNTVCKADHLLHFIFVRAESFKPKSGDFAGLVLFWILWKLNTYN